MHHRCEYKLQCVLSEAERVAVFHFERVLVYAVEAFHHAEGLFVAHDGDVGIVLAYEFYCSAMVGFHMVYYEIVNLSVANYFLNIFDVGNKEIDLNSVYETDFLIVDDVRVV